MKHSYNKNFDNQIKNKLNAIDQSPSTLVWYGIEVGLPTSVSSATLAFKTLLLTTIVLVVSGLTLYFTSSSEFSGVANSAQFGTWGTGKEVLSDVEAFLPAQRTFEHINQADVKTYDNPEARAQFNQLTTASGQIEPQPFSDYQIPSIEKENNWERVSGSSGLMSVEELRYLKYSELDSRSLENLEDISSTPQSVRFRNVDEEIKGFHIGPVVSMNSVWLVNDELDNLRTRERFGYNWKFGLAYGFSVGFDFTPKAGIQIDWIVQSNEGQSFEVFEETGSFRRDVHLNYLRIPVLYKFRMSRLTPINASPMVINYILGLQYGRMNWVNIDDDLEFVKPTDYNEHEWGFVFGLEYDFYAAKNYFLSFGARASVNTDINSFPLLIDSRNERPLNCFVGLTARMNFAFDVEK